MSLDERFQAAVDIVQKLPKDGPINPSNDQKLRFYGLFKQTVVGNVTTQRPGIFSFVERAKWDAWKNQENKPSDQCKEEYIQALLEMINQISEQVNIVEWVNGPQLDPSIKTNLQLLGVQVD